MRNSYSSKFKSKVAILALSGEHTIAEIAGKYNIHPNLVTQWKKKLVKSSPDVFATAKEKKEAAKSLYSEDDLMKKIGTLEMENDFLRKKFDSCL